MEELFAKEIVAGLDFDQLPQTKVYDADVNHAPCRKQLLNKEEKHLALKNALRYFPRELHHIDRKSVV